ncbi:MAG TPA: GNAT family N-acetyltransferase [Candidatus Dorea intestinavium]|nr:GNAT family N-acetyltransferase [Candidatus Dorea intestinavium]
MESTDYGGVYTLWKSINGFGIRSIDDSRLGVTRFLDRNPTTSVVALYNQQVIGSILCGHDGRIGCFYHVCVHKNFRRLGIGKQMVVFAMRALKKEQITKVTLMAFADNDEGNAFWKQIGWKQREDLNHYEFLLNQENITNFNGK